LLLVQLLRRRRRQRTAFAVGASVLSMITHTGERHEERPATCNDGRVPSAGLIRLVLGDEELLVSRAVTEAAAAARIADPDTEVREHRAADVVAGELAEMLSPSLFGGRRLLVLHDA